MENNNRPFFDTYVATQNPQDHGKSNSSNSSFNVAPPLGSFKFPDVPDIGDIDGAITNATKYYEQQYMYYKYLNEVLNYKMKLLEYEKLSQQSIPKPSQPQRQ